MRRPLLVVALAIVAACAGAIDGAGASARTATASPPLRGTRWVLTDRVSIGAPLKGVAVDAVFGTSRVEGTSGCNGYRDSYTTNRRRMTIKNDGVSTLMACGEPADSVERQYRDTLTRVRRWRISGQTLTLSTGTGRRLLVYEAQSGEQALRGSWNVTSFYTGDAISSPITGSTLTITFTEAHAVGDTGCNTFSGPVKLASPERITIGPLASTRRACADAALGTQEQHYLAALDLVKTYRVTGASLTLYRSDGTIGATYERTTQ